MLPRAADGQDDKKGKVLGQDGLRSQCRRLRRMCHLEVQGFKVSFILSMPCSLLQNHIVEVHLRHVLEAFEDIMRIK